MNQEEILHIEPHGDHGETFTRLWSKLKYLDGDVAEFGVYRGGTSRQLSTLTGRKIYAFDTFQGLPKEDHVWGLDVCDEPGKFHPEASVQALFAGWPNIIPVVGRFADTLPTFKEGDLKIVLAYVDCDWYNSAKQVFEFLPKFLVEGAAIVIDDFTSHNGIINAVNEFVETWPRKAQMTEMGRPAIIEWADIDDN